MVIRIDSSKAIGEDVSFLEYYVYYILLPIYSLYLSITQLFSFKNIMNSNTFYFSFL